MPFDQDQAHAGMQQDDEIQNCMHASTAFDAVVAPLERATGQGLLGQNRTMLFEAFQDRRDGFARCAAKALGRAHTNPIGLLVKMVKDGEHRRAKRSLASGAPQSPVEVALAWGKSTAPQLEGEHREQVLAEFRLDLDEQAQVRAVIDRSLEDAARPEARW